MKTHTLFRIPILAAIFLVFCLPFDANAQNPCSKKLNEALNNYQAGNLAEVLKLIEPCIQREAFASESEQQQALRLVALVHLYRDDRGEAEETMEKLLRENPEYEIEPEAEPAEYVKLFNSFWVKPRVRFGVKAGLNMSVVQQYAAYTVEKDVDNGFYNLPIGGRLGVTVDRMLARDLYFSTELIFNLKRVSFTDQLYDFSILEYRENLLYAEIPLSLRYELFGTKKIRPFIRAGVSGSFLAFSSASVQRSFQSGFNNEPIENNGINTWLHRVPADINPLVGLGAGIKLPESMVSVEFRFRPGFFNLTNPLFRAGSTDIGSQPLLFEFYYMHDNLVIHNIEFSIAYSKIYYKVERRKPEMPKPAKKAKSKTKEGGEE